jgi:hypothetical protein
MLSEGVVHTDMHKKNILMQADGRVALIDYGEIHFRGSKEFEEAVREHMMEMQITALMSDSDNFYMLEDRQQPAEATTQDQRIDYFFKNEPVLLAKLKIMLRATGFNGEPAAMYSQYLKEKKEPFLIISFAYDATKLYDPRGFLKMMNFRPDAHLHSWFTFDDLDIIYRNLGNIDKMISEFNNKQY